MLNRTILWRGIQWHGHEACRVYSFETEWRLEGTAVFVDEGRVCRLSYLIACDSSWNTLNGVVTGWADTEIVNIQIVADADRRWQMNGLAVAEVDGCIDLDLNFSPSTNLLPIRRLNLGIGEQAEVKAAWLKFPSFELETLTQIYTRLNERRYRYTSHDGDFVAEIKVDDVGFATVYSDLWEAEQLNE